MKREESEFVRWQEGQSYDISSAIEPILCNVRIKGKMHVRYVLSDPEFFLLIEPEQAREGEYKVKVHLKVILKHVESMVDRNEPRNLIVGFATFEKQSAKPIIEEMLLYFENTHKCTFVKNLIDANKKANKQN